MRRAVVLVLAVFLVATWAWIALRPGPEERLAALIAELRARGEPVSLADMEAPMPPDAQNGAPDLDAAMEWFAEHYPDEDWKTRFVGPWNPDIEAPYQEHATPEQLADLREFLTALAPLFELVDRGADKPEIAWPRRPCTSAADASGVGPEIRTIQSVQRLVAARAISAPEPADRWRAIRTTIGIGAHLRGRDTVERLVVATVFASGCQLLRTEVERGDAVVGSEERARLDALLATEWDARLPDVVRACRASALDDLPFWLDGSMQRELGLVERSGWSEFVRAFRRFWRGRVDGSGPRDPAVMIDWVRELDVCLEVERTPEAIEALAGDPCEHGFNALVFMIQRVWFKLVSADALAHLARVALAARRYRNENGDWPAVPADLDPLFADGVPGDPFTGAPLEMQRDGDALVLRARPWAAIVGEGEDPREYGYVWRLEPGGGD